MLENYAEMLVYSMFYKICRGVITNVPDSESKNLHICNAVRLSYLEIDAFTITL